MFIIFGNLNLVPGKYDEWMDAYKEIEPHALKDEPNLETYYFLAPAEYESNKSKSNFILAFEQYQSKEDLYKTHFETKAMGVFLPKIQATMTTGLDLTNFEEVGGFLDKENKKDAGLVYLRRFQSKSGKRDGIISNLKRLADSVEAQTFYILKSRDNDEDIRVLERYSSKTGLEKVESSKAYLEFMSNNKEDIASMEGRQYVESGYGWLHR
ncbi:MAG: hypothetical protein M1827_004455 [Pycnora praestabilis]|nr:MAG: hypothetical protein M1827_004455 [Pycnora praestabilis]